MSGCCFHSHFVDRETQAQSSLVTSMSHSSARYSQDLSWVCAASEPVCLATLPHRLPPNAGAQFGGPGRAATSTRRAGGPWAGKDLGSGSPAHSVKKSRCVLQEQAGLNPRRLWGLLSPCWRGQAPTGHGCSCLRSQISVFHPNLVSEPPAASPRDRPKHTVLQLKGSP